MSPLFLGGGIESTSSVREIWLRACAAEKREWHGIGRSRSPVLYIRYNDTMKYDFWHRNLTLNLCSVLLLENEPWLLIKDCFQVKFALFLIVQVLHI